MARKTKDEQLTLSQIGNIRATQAKRASQLLGRLGVYASGDADKDGKPKVTMDSNQVKAALGVIGHILPAQQSTVFQDISEPEQSIDQIEQEYRQAIQAMPVTDLMTVLEQMPAEERQALIDSLENTSQ